MSEEIKSDEIAQNENNHEDSVDIEVELNSENDDEETAETSTDDLPRDTQQTTSFADIIPKEESETSSVTDDNPDSNEIHDLFQDLTNKSNKEASSTILNTLVNGDFDLDKNYIIDKPKNLTKLFLILNQLPISLQAEILSLLIGIMRKSERNILAIIDANIYEQVFEILKYTDDDVVANLLIDVLIYLTSFTINNDQIKLLLRYLKSENHTWKNHAIKLLNIFKSLPYRYGPDEFFYFPGRNDSGLVLPPIKTWPYQNGFTISTWFRIDPVVNGVIEKEKPYLFWFCTSKGHGYTGYFVGSCLVLSYSKPKDKPLQHCIQYEFKPREWYMITLTHQYQRWSKSSIQCYVNGQIISTAFYPWSIESGDVFDKCYIGCTPDHNDLTSFSGQLSTFYLFSSYLDPLIIEGLSRLGPAYRNQFKFENESAHMLIDAQRRSMYDGKLTNSIVFNYNPIACEKQLVLQAGPKTNVSYFVHTAHAQMLSNVRSVLTHSIYSTLHSVGGIQVFYPLFGQLDHKQNNGSIDYEICSILLKTLCQLIERSYTVQHQVLSSKGFLILGHYFQRSSKKHMNSDVLNGLISLATFFVKVQSKTSSLLLKQLLVHILFNPSIWIHCTIDVQMRLYTYLAFEFVTYNDVHQSIQTMYRVLQTLHLLKHYYWIVEPNYANYYKKEMLVLDGERPEREHIIEIRRHILLYMKQIIIRSPGTQEEELDALLDYLHTVNEDENIIDVLELCVDLMLENPKNMVPAFDNRQGLRTIFKLLSSTSELIRLQALRLFGLFLQTSAIKRKIEAMQPYNLFSLLTECLLQHRNSFTISTYNILFEILVEKVGVNIVENHSDDITSDWKIENPAMIKVIAALLRNSPDNPHLYDIKLIFLDDLTLLSSSSRDNRRIILQMSVWQEYILGLAYVYPENDQQTKVTDAVFELLKVLLHHAIKFEFGGWRVWIDTLSILHGRITREDYYRKTNEMVENMKDEEDGEKISISSRTTNGSETPTNGQSITTFNKSNSNRQVFSKTNQLPPYTISEFKYSPMHIRLLHNAFDAIETDVLSWQSPNDPVKSIIEAMNLAENHIFCVNVVHMISQMADILSNACGGLLPLLASATSASHEIDIMENTEGLSSTDALRITKRVMGLIDLFVFTNVTNFTELEQEKNMPQGGIIRQCLRLTMTTGVRYCMECRFKRFDTSLVPKSSPPKLPFKDPVASIFELTSLMQSVSEISRDESLQDLLVSFIKNPESVLQDMDIHRLRAIIYRDLIKSDRNKSSKNAAIITDDNKQAQFLALAIIYFTSVLMVSRYRDIIEKTQTSLSRTPSFMSTTTSIRKNSATDAKGDTESMNGLSSTTISFNMNQKIATELTIDDQADGENEGDNTDSQSGDQTSVDLHSTGTAATHYASVASIPINDQSSSNQGQLSESKLPDYPKTAFNSTETSTKNITENLEQALSNTAPFLRDIFTQFSSVLAKTLIGSHGQELLPSGLHALKQTASVVELVMLLCSQEWQNSLQKHAGLAFIELVNEGRVLSHASKDHVVKVANEADFILNRMRAEDIRKASDYEQLCIQTVTERKKHMELCDHFLTSSNQRHYAMALNLKSKYLTQMISDKFAYLNESHLFWKLDPWEDDLRRRRRVLANSEGLLYKRTDENSLNNDMNDDMITSIAQDEHILKQLKQQKMQSFLQTHDDDDSLSQIDEKEIDYPLSGPINFSFECSLISGTLAIPGILSIIQSAIVFDANETDPIFKNLDSKIRPYIENLHGKWHFSEMRAIFSRRYLLQDRALEIFVSNRTSVMFVFDDRHVVKKLISYLPRVGVGGRYGLPQQRRTSLASPKQLFRSANMTQRWQRREISNFEYLMYLNTIAGRTYQDLHQYPIFPWIIADYESKTLDLNAPATYRDLSKPIGALNPARKSFFVERYNKWQSEVVPPFHYSSHYSTAESTLGWLFRLEPFMTYYLNLHDQKFESSSRIFYSIPLSWQNCQRDSSDVRELIPEFFSLPEMFVNCNDYQLGKADNGSDIDDVILPNWAETPEEFIRINRAALESEFVSCHLHQWIDLIFGYKQKGPEAIRAVNVFYYLTYEGAINLDTITNPSERAAIIKEIQRFGQTPAQLLTEPHPPRNSAVATNPTIFNTTSEDVSMIMKFTSNAPIIHVAANTSPTLATQAVVTISNKHDFSINKYNGNIGTPSLAYAETGQTATSQQSQLPLSMDALLILNTGLHRRHLGDSFDECIQQHHQSFVVTADNRFIISTGYWDKSFRVQNTDMAKITQVLYGHFDIVTCICRSEATVSGNCFLATGSKDSTVCIWIWNGTRGAIVDKEYPNQDVNPSPAAILTGHNSEITCLWISAELGFVLSGSEHSLILQHTLQGDILRALDNPSDMATPRLLSPSNDGDIIVCYDRSKLCLYTLNGKLIRQAIFEDETIQSLILNADGQYTVIGGDRGFVQILRTYDLHPVYTYPQCDASIRSLAITHDQKCIIAGLSTGCLIVFNINFNTLNQVRRDTKNSIANPL